MICFLDMDNVLVEFTGGICKVHGRPDPYEGLTKQGEFQIEKMWGITAKEFWAPSNNKEFWQHLDPTVEAEDIYLAAISLFGPQNVAILTAPSKSEWCVPGKQKWIEDHFPDMRNNIIFTRAKKFLAGPGRILVDDKDQNIEEFEEAGGEGILVPRAWNKDWDIADKTLESVIWNMEVIAGGGR